MIIDFLNIVTGTICTLLPEMIKGMLSISDAVETVKVLLIAGAFGVAVPVAWLIYKIVSFIKEHA